MTFKGFNTTLVSTYNEFKAVPCQKMVYAHIGVEL